tara:strand:+ start:1566 stop:2210 length:645 start_codon:yes stop_codon:yes gene_type:complete
MNGPVIARPIALMLTLAVALPAATQSALAQEPLPAVTLRLQCSDSGTDTTSEEVDAVLSLLEFAEAHDGEPVYLDAVIQADAGAGGCSRDVSEFSDQPDPQVGQARISIDPCRVEPRGGEDGRHCWRAGMVDIRASGPPMVLTNSIVLPAQADIPESLPYRIGGYGDWLNYQGAFIARFYTGTGYSYATFHLPDPGLAGVWERARLNAATRARD